MNQAGKVDAGTRGGSEDVEVFGKFRVETYTWNGKQWDSNLEPTKVAGGDWHVYGDLDNKREIVYISHVGAPLRKDYY